MIKPSTVVHFAGLPFGLGIAHCDIGQWHWGNSLREKSTCPQVPQGCQRVKADTKGRVFPICS